jgi:hypothetical protein
MFTWLCAKAASRIKSDASRLIREVDSLQRFAEQQGLVDKLGQDFIQRIMSEHIKPARRRR